MLLPRRRNIIDDRYFSPNWPDEFPHPPEYKPWAGISGPAKVFWFSFALKHGLILAGAWGYVIAYHGITYETSPSPWLCTLFFVVGTVLTYAGVTGACLFAWSRGVEETMYSVCFWLFPLVAIPYCRKHWPSCYKPFFRLVTGIALIFFAFAYDGRIIPIDQMRRPLPTATQVPDASAHAARYNERVRGMTEGVEHVAKLLTTVRDAGSAQDALGQISVIGSMLTASLNGHSNRAQAAREDKLKIGAIYGERMNAARRKVNGEWERIETLADIEPRFIQRHAYLIRGFTQSY